MKKIGTYTARGQQDETQTRLENPARIRLFQGDFKIAYRVREFYVWGSNWGGSAKPDVVGKLSTYAGGTPDPSEFMDASNENEIAWAATSGTAESGGTFGIGTGSFIVDPDNLVLEDLWVYIRSYEDNDTPQNYMVVMDKYEISGPEGAVRMAAERSQQPETFWPRPT